MPSATSTSTTSTTHTAAQTAARTPGNNSREWLSQQQGCFQRLFDELHFLASITCYDPEKKICHRDALIMRNKMTRAEYEQRLKDLMDCFSNADPVSLCMMSQFFVLKCDSRKLLKYTTKIKKFNYKLLVADGEEEAHAPDKVRRKFILIDMVTTGRMLRQWSEGYGAGGAGGQPAAVQGIPLETDTTIDLQHLGAAPAALNQSTGAVEGSAQPATTTSTPQRGGGGLDSSVTLSTASSEVEPQQQQQPTLQISTEDLSTPTAQSQSQIGSGRPARLNNLPRNGSLGSNATTPASASPIHENTTPTSSSITRRSVKPKPKPTTKSVTRPISPRGGSNDSPFGERPVSPRAFGSSDASPPLPPRRPQSPSRPHGSAGASKPRLITSTSNGGTASSSCSSSSSGALSSSLTDKPGTRTPTKVSRARPGSAPSGGQQQQLQQLPAANQSTTSSSSNTPTHMRYGSIGSQSSSIPRSALGLPPAGSGYSSSSGLASPSSEPTDSGTVSPLVGMGDTSGGGNYLTLSSNVSPPHPSNLGAYGADPSVPNPVPPSDMMTVEQMTAYLTSRGVRLHSVDMGRSLMEWEQSARQREAQMGPPAGGRAGSTPISPNSPAPPSMMAPGFNASASSSFGASGSSYAPPHHSRTPSGGSMDYPGPSGVYGYGASATVHAL